MCIFDGDMLLTNYGTKRLNSIKRGVHHLPAVILAYFGGKKKFQTRNFYASETVEYVPEKPLRTHHDKPSSIIRARRALYIPLKNKGGYGGKLITVKIPQMKRLRTKVHNYLLPIYQSTIFAKLK
mgnify:CR=1 FL=1